MSLLAWLLGIGDAGTVTSAQGWAAAATNPWPWYVLAPIALAGLVAAALPWLPGLALPRRSRLALSLIRLAGLAVVALMLLQIELRVELTRSLPPTVAVLVDASASMETADADGATRRSAAESAADALATALAGRAEVARYSYAWRLQPGTAEGALPGSTRTAAAIAEALERERSAQSLVVIGDGADTGGDRGGLVAPLLAARGLPLHAISVGSPQAPPRAELRLTGAAPWVRLGDEAVISASISATGLDGQAVGVALYEVGAEAALARRDNLRLGAAPLPVTFAVRPLSAGVKTYRIAVEGITGASTARLAAEHRVQVIDAKIRILYLDIPRDERKIVGHWLARDPVVDLATLTLLPKGGWYGQGTLKHQDLGSGLPGREADLNQYDLIILGDIPRSAFAQSEAGETALRWLVDFVSRRGGGLVTLGGRSAYGAGGWQDTPVAALLPFDPQVVGQAQAERTYALQPTALGYAHPLMQLAGDAEGNREAWGALPMLDGCNRVGAVRPGASLLATRFLDGAVLPLAAVQDVGRGKVLGLAFDTSWRWQMQRDEDAPDHFRRFWGNVARHLAPDPRLQPDRPQVSVASAEPAVGSTVTCSTRLVDRLFQPIRNADLRVEVKAPSGRGFAIWPRDGRQKPGLYEYEVQLDEPGEWTVTAQHAGVSSVETFRAGGGAEELADLRARPDLLEGLATPTGGALWQAGDAAALAAKLAAAPRVVTQPASVPLWNLPLILILFAGLVGLDCWLRKRRGLP